MPMIRRTIAEMWGPEKLVEDPTVDNPVVACALGAAWQQEDVGTVLERLPFSIVLEADGEEPQELYRAYAPTAEHRTLTTQPEIRPYRFPFDVPRGEGALCLRDTDGLEEYRIPLQASNHRRCFLQIDLFGRIVIRTEGEELQELPNPVQHPNQKGLWQRSLEMKRQREEERERLNRNISRSPFLENV